MSVESFVLPNPDLLPIGTIIIVDHKKSFRVSGLLGSSDPKKMNAGKHRFKIFLDPEASCHFWDALPLLLSQEVESFALAMEERMLVDFHELSENIEASSLYSELQKRIAQLWPSVLLVQHAKDSQKSASSMVLRCASSAACCLMIIARICGCLTEERR